MRQERFDALSRAVGKGMSRRRVVKLLAFSSVGGMVAWSTFPAEAAAGGCGVQTVWVWANVFIPGHLPWLTQTVPAGPHAGKSMIPGPVGNLCYLTDQRYFDPAQGSDAGSHPSSRMVCVAQIDLVNATVLQQYRFTAGTVEINCSSGEVTCAASEQIEGPGFHGAQSDSFLLRFWGANPCVFGSPDLDVDATFTYHRRPNGEVDFSAFGAVDVFPAYEIYARADGGNDTVAVFQNFPAPGTTPVDLLRSQLAVPISFSGRLTNTQVCDPRDGCCPPGTGGANGCCPLGDTCCPANQGGNCCPGNEAPICCGSDTCCPAEYRCCTNRAPAFCCRPDYPQCCANGMCCPSGYTCCGPSTCCPPTMRCINGNCRFPPPGSGSQTTVAGEVVAAVRGIGGESRKGR